MIWKSMLLYKETRKPEPFAQNANAVGSWIGSRHRENGVVAGERSGALCAKKVEERERGGGISRDFRVEQKNV